MESKFEHKKVEKELTEKWEQSGIFKAERDPNKKPYTIVLPPPNASGKMHVGNALMIAVEDILIRWKRMQGYSALWLPGTDHAGFETQTTFERELKKEGKSRFDYDRKTLYDMLRTFVLNNKSAIEAQIKSMGASVDWSRYTFSLDAKSIDIVLTTFQKMVDDGLIYRANYVVNYSFKWGTTFSDAEITMKEQKDPLYYLKYGPFVLATVRPETLFGDTAVAVHPDDARYKSWDGKEIDGPLGIGKLHVITDTYVDPEFGTGVVKITPAHDKNDYEVGLRHNLEVKSVIGLDGRMTALAGKYAGMKVLDARKAVVEELASLGLIDHIDTDYTHLVPVDYRSGDYVEQLVLPNWFVKVDHPKFNLKKAAYDAVASGAITIYPKWQEPTYTRWVENMHDWAISRQIVWGIRVPAWYDVDKNPDIVVSFKRRNPTQGETPSEVKPSKLQLVNGKIGELLKTYSFEEIEEGFQSLIAPINAQYVISKVKPSVGRNLQEGDTFDTWFSSGQWPLITLGYPTSPDFNYFYPTAVLETGWEIITRWVSRMIMFGLYLTGDVPFKEVYLHGRVMAVDGKKMSKSIGNVENPEDYQEKYGTDALRMGLISGTANGKDFSFPKDKILGYRNFANKIWNMGRFILLMFASENAAVVPQYSEALTDLSAADKAILQLLKETVALVDTNLEKYRFADASDAIYRFMWHELADLYIEDVKKREGAARAVGLSVLRHVYLNCLKVLHPFMPFVTEAIWDEMAAVREPNEKKLLAESTWPKAL